MFFLIKDKKYPSYTEIEDAQYILCNLIFYYEISNIEL